MILEQCMGGIWCAKYPLKKIPQVQKIDIDNIQ